jgi:hypothetical protein
MKVQRLQRSRKAPRRIALFNQNISTTANKTMFKKAKAKNIRKRQEDASDAANVDAAEKLTLNDTGPVVDEDAPVVIRRNAKVSQKKGFLLSASSASGSAAAEASSVGSVAFGAQQRQCTRHPYRRSYTQTRPRI